VVQEFQQPNRMVRALRPAECCGVADELKKMVNEWFLLLLLLSIQTISSIWQSIKPLSKFKKKKKKKLSQEVFLTEVGNSACRRQVQLVLMAML
jgi:hypothetical protein